MFFNGMLKKARDNELREFESLWNNEFSKGFYSRDFTEAYKFANKKRHIREECMHTYFDFSSEDSQRYKDACNAFDNGDIFWTFMNIYQFKNLPGLTNTLMHLTNKRRYFLSDKRKDSVVTGHSVNIYVHTLMQTVEKQCDDFIENVLAELETYEQYKKEGKYKSAYKIAALTDKSSEYVSSIKKYLYYCVSRPITDENREQTLKYFDFVAKYYNFKRKSKDGKSVFIDDIDYIMALIIYMRNGGDVSREELSKRIHRTVKVYCVENRFTSVCILADYLYQIGEIDLEKITLDLLVHYGEAVSEKYKKRHTCIELMLEHSDKFIFRHDPRIPIECVKYEPDRDDIYELLKKCLSEKEQDSWCIAIKNCFKSYDTNYRLYYDDKLLSTLETVMDNEFGEYVLEYSLRTYFSSDEKDKSKASMVIVSSGKNKYADFPKIGMLVKLEPVTKKLVNVFYSVLYFPEKSYTEQDIVNDANYIQKLLSDDVDSRFITFSNVVENLIWSTVDSFFNK